MKSLLLTKYSSGDQIKKNERAGHVECMGKRGIYRILVGKPEKKKLERLRLRWEGNVKMDLQTVGQEDRDWIDLAQGRESWRALVEVVMNIHVP